MTIFAGSFFVVIRKSTKKEGPIREDANLGKEKIPINIVR